MRVLDISPYYWEKMVLTMGSTLDIVTTGIPETSSYKHHGIAENIPLVENHGLLLGNLLDHSIINYVERINMINPSVIL